VPHTTVHHQTRHFTGPSLEAFTGLTSWHHQVCADTELATADVYILARGQDRQRSLQFAGYASDADEYRLIFCIYK